MMFVPKPVVQMTEEESAKLDARISFLQTEIDRIKRASPAKGLLLLLLVICIAVVSIVALVQY